MALDPDNAPTSHLLRSHAPISDAGWRLIDQEARQRLTPALAARQLVDFAGPLGWDHAATSLGRAAALAAGEGVHAAAARVLPLVELSAGFSLPRRCSTTSTAAADPDLDALDPPRCIARRGRDGAVFHG